jgi:hypothetical protein
VVFPPAPKAPPAEEPLTIKERRKQERSERGPRTPQNYEKRDAPPPPPNPNVHGWDSHPPYLRGKWLPHSINTTVPEYAPLLEQARCVEACST